mmetsp:Transcript_23169/g.52483  ORF Transcript_23169/g.52483 Transcript_23169/m.52483 type:complete len:95 (+) Transcript_23169:235-519(+)
MRSTGTFGDAGRRGVGSQRLGGRALGDTSGFHSMPIVCVNVDGYYYDFRHATQQGGEGTSRTRPYRRRPRLGTDEGDGPERQPKKRRKRPPWSG